MALWKDQTPGETILSFGTTIRDHRYTVEIDIPERSAPATKMYRLTIGNLWDYREVQRSDNLETLVRRAYRFANAETVREARLAIGVTA